MENKFIRDFDLVAASYADIYGACMENPGLVTDILKVCADTSAIVAADFFAVSQQVADHINAQLPGAPEIDDFMGQVWRVKALAVTVQKAINAANQAAADLQD